MAKKINTGGKAQPVNIKLRGGNAPENERSDKHRRDNADADRAKVDITIDDDTLIFDSETDSEADNATGEAASAAGAGAGTAGKTGAGASETGDTVSKTEHELTKLREELADERDKNLRLRAEYDNYRKRSMKERETTYSDARADTIVRLLPVYDNLERALKTPCADEAFYKGIDMMMTQLTELFDGMNVKPIPSVGQPFDPNLHNAILSIENPELGEKTVAEECQKGFRLGDRVIRHSTVVVAN